MGPKISLEKYFASQTEFRFFIFNSKMGGGYTYHMKGSKAAGKALKVMLSRRSACEIFPQAEKTVSRENIVSTMVHN